MKSEKLKLHFQRFEFKYQIPVSKVEGLIPKFIKHMDIDPYAIGLTDNSYTVASLYYDTAGLDCYHEKLAGVRSRKKLRIRFYDDQFTDQTPVFVEIKKKYDTVVVKDRARLSYADCYDIMVNENISRLAWQSEQAKDFLNDFLWLRIYNGMTPQNMVIYKRMPFISKLDPEFRVTIDYDLRTYQSSWLDVERTGHLVNPEIAVLEVKFNNVLPFWFHQIIQKHNLHQRPFSKYCESLEIAKPQLNPRSIQERYQWQFA